MELKYFFVYHCDISIIQISLGRAIKLRSDSPLIFGETHYTPILPLVLLVPLLQMDCNEVFELSFH